MPLATSDDIKWWANQPGASTLLHELVLQLIYATTSADDRAVAGFRTGLGVNLGGWDGITEVAEGNDFVPSGVAGWELSTRRDPGVKARSDFAERVDAYADRGADSGQLDPATVTFVAVTGQRWDSDRFIVESTARGVFAGVNAIDADALFRWMLLAPAVHVWFSEKIGLHPPGAVSAEERWREYSESSGSALSAAVFVAGNRQDVSEALLHRMQGGPGILRVGGASAEDALAFVLASLAVSPNALRNLTSRLVVVEEREAWRGLARNMRPLILVAALSDSEIIWAARDKHLVIAPEELTDGGAGERIRLGPIDPATLRVELARSGLGEGEVERIMARAPGSADALRAALDQRRNPVGPEWARPGASLLLGTAVLAGAWEADQPADREVLEALTGESWRELVSEMKRWRLSPRAPIEKIGERWLFRNRAETFGWLAPSILEDDLRRFADIAVDVLGTDDPKFELAVDERWAAGVHGKRPKHSLALRKGLSDGLAMIAVQESALGHLTLNGQEVACMAVRRTLGTGGWRRWASLGPVLRSLAEACPEELLSCLEIDVSDADAAEMVKVFTDTVGAISTDSPHTELLWTLELLARAPEHLSRVAMMLASLEEIDPGGALSNRPIRSLITVLNPFLPQTGASWERQREVLDTLVTRFPTVGWAVLRGLLPVPYLMMQRVPTPKWRSWPIPELPS